MNSRFGRVSYAAYDAVVLVEAELSDDGTLWRALLVSELAQASSGVHGVAQAVAAAATSDFGQVLAGASVVHELVQQMEGRRCRAFQGCDGVWR